MSDVRNEMLAKRDLESALNYLRIHDPENATMEGAMDLLGEMKNEAHKLAHDIVDELREGD